MRCGSLNTAKFASGNEAAFCRDVRNEELESIWNVGFGAAHATRLKIIKAQNVIWTILEVAETNSFTM
jgi:hypothetical protein